MSRVKTVAQKILQIEMNVTVGVKERVQARVLLWRLPEAAAARRRAKLRENAKKHGRVPTSDTLALCDWNLYITNVEKKKLSLELTLSGYPPLKK